MSGGKPLFVREEEDTFRRADVIFVRWYDTPEDERRCPLSMRPLMWRSSKPGKNGAEKPVYGVVLAATVAMRICVVPDYSRPDNETEAGCSLINDLAYLAPDDFMRVLPARDEDCAGMSAKHHSTRVDV